MYKEDDYLMLSGLQHFVFCRRQWALIHIEQQWSENERTIDGELIHKKAHDERLIEKRGDLLITRGLSVRSAELGISGTCDVVEFRKTEDGIPLSGHEGLWQAFPVEYKRGEPKQDYADEAQLCAQAMCLEEMLQCSISSGSLFYGENRRRMQVVFSESLRSKVKDMTKEMHLLWGKGYTPQVKSHKGCNACSLKEICLPELNKSGTVSNFISQNLAERQK